MCIFYFENIVLINLKGTLLKIWPKLQWLYSLWKSRECKCQSFFINPLFDDLKYSILGSIIYNYVYCIMVLFHIGLLIMSMTCLHDFNWLFCLFCRSSDDYWLFWFLNFKVNLSQSKPTLENTSEYVLIHFWRTAMPRSLTFIFWT